MSQQSTLHVNRGQYLGNPKQRSPVALTPVSLSEHLAALVATETYDPSLVSEKLLAFFC